MSVVSRDLYFFDCFGIIVKRNVFSKERIDLANSIVDNAKEKRRDGGYKILDIFESHEVFIDFFVSKEITDIAAKCLGGNFRLDHGFIVEQTAKTDPHNHLHGKSFGKDAIHYYLTQGVEGISSPCWTRTGQLSVGVILKGQQPSTGGLGYIKGSHKSSYFVRGQEILESYLKDDSEFFDKVTIPKLNAGDVIIFPENLCHGQSRMKDQAPLRRTAYGMLFPSYAKFAKWDESIERLKIFSKSPMHEQLLSDAYIVENLNSQNVSIKPKTDEHQ
jgi:ectoine hydroxylase-related dioxygenase (phytanoyl-CoA dioxygenase family)